MASTNAAFEYRKQAVGGASPLQLVIMLYDGAIRFMEAGKQAMAHGNLQAQNDNLQRAQKIVLELMSCLDMVKGGEIASNLLALYTYIVNELVEGNISDNPECIERCIKILSDLRSGWSGIEQATHQDNEQPIAA